MKYQIGDKIIVLHSDEEGKVIEIINEKMVMIEVRGVKFPAYMDQIDFPYYKMFTQKKVVEKRKIHVDEIKKEKSTPRKKIADGVFVHLLPVYDKDIFEDDVVEKLKVFLVNYNEEEYHFNYQLQLAGGTQFELKSDIRGLCDFYLHDIAFEDMSDNPCFHFEFSLVKEDRKKSPFYECDLKLKGKQIFKKIEELQEKNEPAVVYQLFIQYPNRVEDPKMDLSKLSNAGFKIYDLKEGKTHLPPARSVVDLHADKLTDRALFLSGAEILDLQLSTFEKYLELATLHHLSNIIFIHGIGEGVLKQELHERLKLHNKVKSFINRYHPQYGYGATEVVLQ